MVADQDTNFFPNSDSKLMFLNAFFEGAIYLKFMVADLEDI